jgi:hypothetical protein
MIRKLKSGQYRLYSRKLDPKTRRRRNLGRFDTREGAQRHEREVPTLIGVTISTSSTNRTSKRPNGRRVILAGSASFTSDASELDWKPVEPAVAFGLRPANRIIVWAIPPWRGGDSTATPTIQTKRHPNPPMLNPSRFGGTASGAEGRAVAASVRHSRRL